MNEKAIISADAADELPVGKPAFEITENLAPSAICEEAGRPHRHKFYEIAVVLESDGRHVMDCATYSSIVNSVFVM